MLALSRVALNLFMDKEGFEHKVQLMRYFLKEKEAGYYQLKNEWEQFVLNGNGVHKEEVK